MREDCIVGENLVYNSFYIRQRTRRKQRLADLEDLLLRGLHACLALKAGATTCMHEEEGFYKLRPACT